MPPGKDLTVEPASYLDLVLADLIANASHHEGNLAYQTGYTKGLIDAVALLGAGSASSTDFNALMLQKAVPVAYL